MITFLAWTPGLVLYCVLLAWYLNWRGRLKPAEIDALMKKLELTGAGENGRNALATMRKFLEADDGREFFMLNLVRISTGDVADPETGELRPARKVLEGYTRMFMPALLARGGHPAIVARKVGGYFDAWGAESDPGWTFIGYMRYRSRRDLALLASDPRFGGAHDFKFAAMPNTFSFPTQPQLMALQSPVVWVGVLLAMVSAVAETACLLVHAG